VVQLRYVRCTSSDRASRERRVELTGQVEIVGSVDSGIKAACWSPDDEQLVLVTGELA
jgi:hypothetical protein